MLRLQNITKNYKVAGGEIEVLKHLSCQLGLAVDRLRLWQVKQSVEDAH